MSDYVWVFIRSGSFKEGWDVVAVYDDLRTPDLIRPELEWERISPTLWSTTDVDSPEYEKTYLGDIFATRMPVHGAFPVVPIEDGESCPDGCTEHDHDVDVESGD